eukprot:g16898.t1
MAVLSAAVLVISWDIRRFYRQRKQYAETIEQLFKAKRQLQSKAHAYSGHSDKLKLFISERLLEYIQYDEKFLHFKNIAAEVRHNGVICFDQVQTALTTAISSYEERAGEVASEEAARCESAIASMRYLWDLLDLSTTDNIALHVANHLCECEEHYFQSLLQTDEDSSPYVPTYEAHRVVVDVLSSALENTQLLQDVAQGYVDETRPIHYSDSLFFVRLDTGIEMLGNENHLRLLVENLINNAQFYLKKTNAAKTQKPIAVELVRQEDQMQLAVYNRGEHIDEENKEKIFQLGFSTRRKKENHGKGLGLYFANSIAQGYEGDIRFDNIKNKADTYSVRIELENGEVVTEIVETSLVDGLPAILNAEDDTAQKQMEWKFSSLLKSIEIFSKLHQQTYLFADVEEDATTYTDPENSAIPAWSVTTANRKRSSSLVFTPMDISGVKFLVTLPTAKTRLDYSETADDSDGLLDQTADTEDLDDSYDNIIELEKRFKA